MRFSEILSSITRKLKTYRSKSATYIKAFKHSLCDLIRYMRPPNEHGGLRQRFQYCAMVSRLNWSMPCLESYWRYSSWALESLDSCVHRIKTRPKYKLKYKWLTSDKTIINSRWSVIDFRLLFISWVFHEIFGLWIFEFFHDVLATGLIMYTLYNFERELDFYI